MTDANLDSELAEKEKRRRKGKTLRFEPEYAEWIKEQTKERYGSLQKQARFMENVIDFYRDNHGDVASMQGDISEIKRMVEEIQENGVAVDSDVQDAGEELQVNTNVQDTVTDGTNKDVSDNVSGAEKLEQMAHNGEAINPTEYDLSVANGARGIDRPAILIAAMKDDSTRNRWTKKDIQRLAADKMGYTGSGANQRANEVVDRLNENPLVELEEEWLPKRVRKDINGTRMQYSKTTSPDVYERQIGRSLESYAACTELPTNEYYITDTALAEGMYEAFKKLQDAIDNPKNKQYRERAKDVKKKLEIELEIWLTELPNSDMTLNDAVAALENGHGENKWEYPEWPNNKFKNAWKDCDGYPGFAAFVDEFLSGYEGEYETVVELWEEDIAPDFDDPEHYTTYVTSNIERWADEFRSRVEE